MSDFSPSITLRDIYSDLAVSLPDRVAEEMLCAVAKGRSFLLVHDHYAALIDTCGAAIQGLWWKEDNSQQWYPLMENYGKESPYTCGQTLIPWPNRIQNGVFRYGEVRVQLEVTEPALSNAIHGLAAQKIWTVAERAADGRFLTLSYVHTSTRGTGWPWDFVCSVRYEVGDEGLTVRPIVVNKSTTTMPWGYGAHPYVTAGGAPLNECTLVTAADDWWHTTDRNLPTGDHTPVGQGGVPDLSSPCLMEDVWLDTPFTLRSDETCCAADADHDSGAEKDEEWQVVAQLSGPMEGGTVTTTVEACPSLGWLQLFTTGEKTVPFPGKEQQEGRALAIEPMSCPPNAMVSGLDRQEIAPGKSWSAHWRVSGDFCRQ